MASELSKSVTFFDGVINSSSAQQNSEKKRLPRVTRLSENRTTKATRKSKSPDVGGRKSEKTASLHKENLVSKKTETKKPGRISTKGAREPLKVLNTQVKTPLKNNVSSLKKKNTVSPSAKKKGDPVSTSKTVAKASPSPAKTVKVQKQSIPVIIVHKDVPKTEKVQEKESKNKCIQRLSKSWDESHSTSRKSLRVTRKSPDLSVSKVKNARYSWNDLSSVRASNKVLKNEIDKKKSPIKPKPRPTKLKLGDLELEERFAKLETLFPNVDPEFMRSQVIKFKGSLTKIIEFLITKEKTNELPTKFDYLRRLETERLQNKFMESFSVENYLKMIPDPWEHFLKTEKQNCVGYLGHSLHYLKTKYKKHYLQAIQAALVKNGCSLYLANKELKKKNAAAKMRVTSRSKFDCDAGRPTTFDIQFMLEVAFIENEQKIRSYIKKAESDRDKRFREAEEAGTLLECQSCNAISLLQDDVVNCPANHVSCRDCVVKYVQIELGKDNFQFKCLMKCEEKFSVESLQAILSPLLIAKIVKRNQLEEIKLARINDLVCCPFCFSVAILPPAVNVLKCLNPSCMMASCRHCRQPNHFPLKCYELANFDQTFKEIEEQKNVETETEENEINSTDIHPDTIFLKREDSDQMVSPCGATMCSVCRQPFSECRHSTDEACNQPPRLSSSSDERAFAESAEGNAGQDDAERSSNSSEYFLEFLPSESDTF